VELEMVIFFLNGDNIILSLPYYCTFPNIFQARIMGNVNRNMNEVDNIDAVDTGKDSQTSAIDSPIDDDRSVFNNYYSNNKSNNTNNTEKTPGMNEIHQN
jgi:hypothetical protein